MGSVSGRPGLVQSQLSSAVLATLITSRLLWHQVSKTTASPKECFLSKPKFGHLLCILNQFKIIIIYYKIISKMREKHRGRNAPLRAACAHREHI